MPARVARPVPPGELSALPNFWAMMFCVLSQVSKAVARDCALHDHQRPHETTPAAKLRNLHKTVEFHNIIGIFVAVFSAVTWDAAQALQR